MEPTISQKLKFAAQMVEKFVEHNLVEKEQREENIRKLTLAFESFLKDNPFSQASRNGKSVRIKVKKLENFKGELPKPHSALASGMDVRAQLNEEIVLNPGQRVLVPTALCFAIPEGYEIQARPRSGWAIRDGISLANTPGTIDADYRGEVKVILINLGENPVVIRDQDRVAQLVVAPVIQAEFVEVEKLDETSRGAGGFGSTGKA